VIHQQNYHQQPARGYVVRAFVLQSVDLGSIPSSSRTKRHKKLEFTATLLDV